MCIFLV
ncbi:hypothetical protein Nmel_002735 [Mimus melanotis]